MADKSSRDGVEVVLDWVPNPSFNTRVAYTYQDFVFEEFVSGSSDFGGNKEPGAPPHRVFVGFNYTAPFGLRSGASGSTGRRPSGSTEPFHDLQAAPSAATRDEVMKPEPAPPSEFRVRYGMPAPIVRPT